MNYTENYQLNQWEQSDRVLMEDFNADNAKLDAALKANADAVTELSNRSRFTKLKEFTSTEASSFLEIYLNDIDWAAWDKVHVDIQAPRGGSYYFYVADAESSSGHIGSISCNSNSGSSFGNFIRIFILLCETVVALIKMCYNIKRIPIEISHNRG